MSSAPDSDITGLARKGSHDWWPDRLRAALAPKEVLKAKKYLVYEGGIDGSGGCYLADRMPLRREYDASVIVDLDERRILKNRFGLQGLLKDCDLPDFIEQAIQQYDDGEVTP